MAFPAVQTADTKNGTVTSNSTSWTLTYPTNLASGDLILAFVATDGNTTTTPSWPAGWVSTATTDSNTATTLIVAKKLSAGTETGNFTLTLPASEQGGWRIFRITGWGADLGTTFDNTSTSKDVVIASTSGASTTPNPPSLDPDPWGTEDVLWVAAMAADTSRTISTFPTNYTTTSSDVSGGATGATLATSFRNVNAASEDPGTYTISASDDWVAATVAIASVGASPNTVLTLDNTAAATATAQVPTLKVNVSLSVGNAATSTATAQVPTVLKVATKSLAVSSVFSLSAVKRLYNRFTIPETVDAGDQTSLSALLDGGDQSASPTYTFDGLNQNLEYFNASLGWARARLLTITSSFSPTLTFVKKRLVALNASMSNAVALTRAIFASISMAASSSLAPAISKVNNLYRTLSQTLTTTSSIQRRISVSLNKTVSLAAALFTQASRFLTLSVVNLFDSVVAFSINKKLAAAATFNASLTKFTNVVKTIAATTSLTASSLKLIFKNLVIPDFIDAGSESSSGDSVIDGGDEDTEYTSYLDGPSAIPEFFLTAVQATRLKLLSVISTNAAVLSKLTIKNLSITLSNVVDLVTEYGAMMLYKSLEVALTLTTNISKSLQKTLSVTAVLSAAISRLAQFFRTLAATASNATTLVSIAARWVSLTVLEGFSATIIRLPIKLLSASSSLSGAFQRRVSLTLTRTSVFVNSMFTNASRFVSLNVLATYSSATTQKVIKFINASLSATLNIQKRVSLTLNGFLQTTSSIVKNVRLALSASLSTTNDYLLNVGKNVAATASTSLKITRQSYRTLSATINYVTNITTISARYISLTILTAFNAVLVRLPVKILNTSLATLSTLQKNVRKTLSASLTDSLNLFTQSSRFVALNVLFSAQAVLSRTVRKMLDASSLLTAAVQKRMYRTLSAAAATTLNITKQIFSTLTTTLTQTVNLFKNVTATLSASVYETLSLTKISRFYRTLAASASQAVNIITITARYISLSVLSLFSATLVKTPVKLLSASTSYAVQFQKRIAKFLSLGVTNSLNLFTQASRFVALAVLSSFETFVRIRVIKYINASTQSAVAITKALSKTLANATTLATNISRRITSTLSVTFSASVALTKALFETLNVSATYSSVLSTSSQFFRSLAASVSNTVAVTSIALRSVSLAVLESFNAVLAKTPVKVLAYTSSISVAVTKNIGKFVTASINNSVNLFTQASRFVTLSVLPTISSTLDITVGKFIRASTSATVQINRYLYKTLALNLNALVNLSKNARKTIATNLYATLNISKALSKYISLTSTFQTVLATPQAFFRLLAVSASLTTSLSTRALRLASLAVASLFDVNLVRLPNKILNAAANNATQVRKTITASLASTSTYISSLYTASSRFVSLNVLFTLQNTLASSVQRFRTIAVNANLAAFVQRRIDKFIRSFSEFNVSILRNISQSLTTTLTASVSLVKRAYALLAVNGLLSVAINTSTRFFRTLAVSSSSAINLVIISFRYISLTIASLFESTIVRLPNKILSATTSTFVNFQKIIVKSLNATLLAITSLYTASSRFVSLNVLFSIQNTLNATVQRFRSLEVMLTLTTAIQRRITATLNVLASFSVNISRTITQTLSVAVTNSLRLIKQAYVSLAADNILTAEISTLSRFFRALNASANAAINLIVISSRYISMSVASLFSSSLLRLPNKVLSISVTYSNNIQRRTSKTLSLVNTAVTSLFTQSSRFVSIAILSLMQANVVARTIKYLNAVPEFFTTMQLRITALLEATVEAFVSITRSISKTINLSLETITSVQKNISHRIATSPTLYPAVARLVYFYRAIAATMNTAVAIGRLSLRNVTLAVLNLFSINLVKLPNKLLALTTDVALQLRKAAYVALSNSLTATTALFTTTFRFINLAVLSGMTTNITALVRKIIAASIESAVAIQKRITSTLNSTATALLTLTKVPVKLLSVTAEVVPTITRRMYEYIAATSTLFTEVVTFTQRYVSLATLNMFNTFIVKLPNKLLSNTTEFATNVSRNVRKTLSAGAQLVSLLFTSSSRFLTLSALSGFVATRGNLQIAKLISASSSYATRIQRRITASLLVVGNFASVVRTGNIGKYIQASYEGISVVQKRITHSISSALNGSVAVNTQALFYRLLTIGLETTSNLIVFTQRYVSLALLSGFATSFRIRVGKYISTSVNTLVLIQRNVAKSLATSANWVALVFTQSSRFVAINIINLFEPVLSRPAFGKIIAATTNLTSAIQRRITSSLAVVSNLQSAIQNRITQTLATSTELIAAISRRVGKTLATSFAVTIDIPRRVAKTLSVVLTQTLLVTKGLSKQLTVSVQFIGLIAETSLRYVAISVVTLFSAASRILTVKNLAATSVYVAQLTTTSVRFLTLAVVNLFNTSIIKRIIFGIGAQFQSSFETFIPRIQKNITHTLQASFLSRLRTRFIFSKKGTKFAVNKSTPGSEGHATPTMNKSGTSIKPKNKSGTSIKPNRGDTKPLE